MDKGPHFQCYYIFGHITVKVDLDKISGAPLWIIIKETEAVDLFQNYMRFILQQFQLLIRKLLCNNKFTGTQVEII